MLPGDSITFEDLMDETAITYPYTTVTMLSGEMIKTILEDVADNLFNPDPYLQQGGDMVRVAGMTYAIAPDAAQGARISDMRVGDRPIEAAKTYKVAGWAPVSEDAKTAGGEAIYDIVARHLRREKVVKPRTPWRPRLVGVGADPGIGDG
jgi:sulfur-oxidizing protein SoxB